MNYSANQNVLREPLSAMLETKAKVRTLRVLCMHGGLLSAPALVQRTGLAKASVAIALRSLERLGVVGVFGDGRAVLYQMSDAHPLAEAVFHLFQAEAGRFQAILDAIKAAADRGALAAWIYGSAARGDDDEASDVDVAVALRHRDETVEDSIREQLIAAGQRLAFKPSPVFLEIADVARLHEADDPWWRNLVADSIVLHGERPDWLAQRAKRETLSGGGRTQ